MNDLRSITNADLLVTDALKSKTKRMLGFGNPSLFKLDNIPPVIVVKAAGIEKWLILDGNNRAALREKFGAEIDVYEIQSAEDLEYLLYLESTKTIPQFPHRDFLTGKMTLASVVDQAGQWWRRLGSLTANDLGNWTQLEREDE